MCGICCAVNATTSTDGSPLYTVRKLKKSRPAAPSMMTRFMPASCTSECGNVRASRRCRDAGSIRGFLPAWRVGGATFWTDSERRLRRQHDPHVQRERALPRRAHAQRVDVERHDL